ncbi:MAG: helix-turn-helix domain-containing protein [Oligoflexales bacterium]|nr:helix-turn-helix domain-containing protein [Oligoflexales bacterium]
MGAIQLKENTTPDLSPAAKAFLEVFCPSKADFKEKEGLQLVDQALQLGELKKYSTSHQAVLNHLIRRHIWKRSLLGAEQNSCYPSIKCIAKVLKRSKDTARRIVNQLVQAGLIRRIETRTSSGLQLNNLYTLTDALYLDWCILIISKHQKKTSRLVYTEALEYLKNLKKDAIRRERDRESNIVAPSKVFGIKGAIKKKIRLFEEKLELAAPAQEKGLAKKIEQLRDQLKVQLELEKNFRTVEGEFIQVSEGLTSTRVGWQESDDTLVGAKTSGCDSASQTPHDNTPKITTHSNVGNARASAPTQDPSIKSFSPENKEQEPAKPAAEDVHSTTESKTSVKAQEVRDQAMAIAMASPQDQELAKEWLDWANKLKFNPNFNLVNFTGYICQIRQKLQVDHDGVKKMFEFVKSEKRPWWLQANTPQFLIKSSSKCAGELWGHELMKDIGMYIGTKRKSGDYTTTMSDLKQKINEAKDTPSSNPMAGVCQDFLEAYGED